MPYRFGGRQIDTRYVFITEVQFCTQITIAPVFHIHLPVIRDTQWAHRTPQFHRDITSPHSENKFKNSLCSNACCDLLSLLVFGKNLWQNHALHFNQLKMKEREKQLTPDPDVFHPENIPVNGRHTKLWQICAK